MYLLNILSYKYTWNKIKSGWESMLEFLHILIELSFFFRIYSVILNYSIFSFIYSQRCTHHQIDRIITIN